MSKGYDGWQNDYFDPEYEDEEEEDYDSQEVGLNGRSVMDDLYLDGLPRSLDEWWNDQDIPDGWWDNERKLTLWQWLSIYRWRVRFWWRNTVLSKFDRCPDCKRPMWRGNHDGCIPF